MTKFILDETKPDMILVMAVESPAGRRAPVVAAAVPRRGGSAELYAQEIMEALQRRFGAPEPMPAEGNTFLGVPIPEALDEVRELLIRAEPLPHVRRTPAMHDAIARFIRYCDAEGIPLQRRPAPEA